MFKRLNGKPIPITELLNEFLLIEIGTGGVGGFSELNHSSESRLPKEYQRDELHLAEEPLVSSISQVTCCDLSV